MKIDQLHRNRVAELYAMRSHDGFPPRMPKADMQFHVRNNTCDADGRPTREALAFLLKWETPQMPYRDKRTGSSSGRIVAITADGTACYVRRREWDYYNSHVEFWLMIDFAKCMFGVVR